MALFYLIAKKEIEIDWQYIHRRISNHSYNYISTFPIPSTIDSPINGIGITASGKFENFLKEVKSELITLLEILWENNFIIFDLYKGKKITIETYGTILSYL